MRRWPANVISKSKIETTFRQAAKVSLGVGIVFSPFQFRFLLMANEIPPIYRDYTDGSLFLSDIFLLAALIIWVIQLALRPRRISFAPLFISLPLAGLVAVGVLSSVFSSDPGLSLYNTARLLALAGLYLYIINEIKTLDEVIWAIAGLVFIQAGIGIVQVLGQSSVGLERIGELALDPSKEGVSIMWTETARTLRAYGLSSHPNILGGVLALTMLLLANWFSGSQRNTRVIIASVFFSGAMGLLLTFSRLAWFAFGIGLLVSALMLLYSRQKRTITQLIYLIIACLLLCAPLLIQNAQFLGNRLAPEMSEHSRNERAALNQAANLIFSQHAFTGVGYGVFPQAIKGTQPGFPYDFQPPHNVMLSAATETGLFGALFLSIAVISPWVALWLRRKRLDFTPGLTGASAALAGIILIGVYDYYPWSLAPGITWTLLIWGLWGAFYKSAQRKA